MENQHASGALQRDSGTAPDSRLLLDALYDECLSNAAYAPGSEAVELPYSELLSVSGADQPLCEVRASEDISEDCCRAALTLFLVESCHDLGALARRAMAHVNSWEKHAVVLASLPKSGACVPQHVSDLVALLHERGALRIALVVVEDSTTCTDSAWKCSSALYGVRGVVSVATLGVGVGAADWHELPSVPLLHVLPPGAVASADWTCEATGDGALQAVGGLRRCSRRLPSASTAAMKLLPPCAELWELDSASPWDAAVLAGIAAWTEQHLRRETLRFSCDVCELVLRADARLDEGMLYVDDPFDDLDSDDESSEDSASAASAADNCGTSRGSGLDLPADEMIVHQDTTGATFCWPAALALSNFLLEHKAFIRGKRVLEIGAGLGLPGICCAHALQPAAVLLTDGSAPAVSRLSDNVASNPCTSTEVKTAQVQWSEEAGRVLVQSFKPDVVIAADVAYPFKDNSSLLHMLGGLLNTNCGDSDRAAPQVLLGYGWRDLKGGQSFVQQLEARFTVVELCRIDPPSELASGGDAGVAISVFVITKVAQDTALVGDLAGEPLHETLAHLATSVVALNAKQTFTTQVARAQLCAGTSDSPM